MRTSERFDVVVVGGGLAGTVAALRAQECRGRTLLLDKTDVIAGASNTVLSQGILHLGGVSVLSPERELRAAIASRRGRFGNPAVTDAVLNHRDLAMRWLAAQGVPTEVVDTGDAKLTGFAPFIPLPHVDQWQSRGPDLALRRLRHRFGSLGGRMLRRTMAIELIQATVRDGIAGVVIRTAGRTKPVDAGAVILADGGFQANHQMLCTYVGMFADRCKLRAASGATGDGIRMAEAVRAKLVNLQYFYGHLLHRDSLTSDALWPHPRADPLLEVGILVTNRGRRFVDEGLGGVAAANAAARLEDPQEIWIVTGDDGWQTARRAARSFDTFEDVGTEIGRRGGRIIRAPDLESLAQGMDTSVSELRNTIDSYNRGADPIRRTGQQKALMHAPFYAIPVVPGITFTLGGIAIDNLMRAVSLDGDQIPGLYAAGGTIGGLSGGPRGGYVGGLFPALASGLIAGTDAASVALGRRGS